MLRETSSCPGANRGNLPLSYAGTSCRPQRCAALTITNSTLKNLSAAQLSIAPQGKCAIALPRLGGTSRRNRRLRIADIVKGNSHGMLFALRPSGRMKSLESVATRKRTGRLVAFVHCAVAIVTLTGCAGQKEFERGYALGSGDAVKRQYWIQQNMQKADQSSRLSAHTLPDTGCARSRREGQDRPP